MTEFNPAVAMTLGSITFVDREIPPNFGDLGGRKELVVTEFPGGQVAAQYMGSFPEPKTWSGELFGANVQTRAAQLSQLWQTSEAVTLTVGQWSYYGAVEKFKIDQEQQNYIKYTCTFRVFQDNSQGNNASTNPTSDSTGQVASASSAVNSTVANNSALLPTLFPASTTAMTSSLQSAVQQAGNSVSSLSQPQVSSFQNQISGLQSQLSASLSSSNPETASAAYSANTALGNLSNALGATSPALNQITVDSPDLAELASIYYDDPGLWTLIADENADENGPLDADLTGIYTLTIPAAPSVSSSDDLMWQEGAA